MSTRSRRPTASTWSSSGPATSPSRSTPSGRQAPASFAEAIETIIAAALAHGKTAGIFCAKPEDVGRWAAKGASFFILASDTMFLGAGVAAGQAAARDACTDDKAR